MTVKRKTEQSIANLPANIASGVKDRVTVIEDKEKILNRINLTNKANYMHNNRA
jgi:hypothetical protein